jgi:predicted lipid-binding transport protein (Tim44 family)
MRLRLRGRSATGASPLEVEAFLQVARQSFVRLQQAWDDADLPTLAKLTTEPLLEELRDQLAQRGPEPNHTEVLRLEARLLALEELREAFVASVEFSGLIRERIDAGAAPFRELWLLANPKTPSAGAGWRLARVQALS